MSANYELRGDVAVITMDNPPVNGLGYATRAAVVDGIGKAEADANVKAVVITGAGKAFSGGADIKEFGTPKALAEPNLLSVILALEATTKPVVAAIHSVCMGGGLELALGAHYRVAAPGTSVALPPSFRISSSSSSRPACVRAIATTWAPALASARAAA